ncbi:MAG: 6-carboxytetrahydropterin synthase [Phycisphaerales bacterium]|nr:6-carboxytetrahydropterin synthase [Phycisphaerales bacterium]
MAATCALKRTTRFEVAPGGVPVASTNGYSANPACEGLGAYFEATVECRGEPQSSTGMVENIYRLDTLVRAHLAPRLAAALAPHGMNAQAVLADFLNDLPSDAPCIESIELKLNPRCSVKMHTKTMQHVLLSHRWQFAASHRLHNPELDDATNESTFGKCCRPSGHGHNYWIEIDVVALIDGPFNRHIMDSIVDMTIINRFDHRNLNVDCAEFAHRMSTVENITIVCHDLLQGPIASAGGELQQVRVWETEKTWAAYPCEKST